MRQYIMIGIKTSLLSLMTGGLCLASLHAGSTMLGPDWDEDTNGERDAGNTKGTAMEVKLATTTQVTSITGKLKGEGSGNLASLQEPDYQDVYAVAITDPSFFEIRTISPGFSEFNSSLFVFDAEGKPLLANRVVELGTTGARVGEVSTNGKFKIDEPGLIYIAVSGRASVPLDEDGNIQFAFTNDPTDVVGPAGPNTSPLAGWTTPDPTEIGSYVIRLQAVGPIPTGCGAPNAGSCSDLNPLPYCNEATCCSTVCELDPFCCEVTWDSACVNIANERCTDSCENCDGDLDGNNTIDGGDLARLLALWRLNDTCADINNDGIVDGEDLSILLLKWGTDCS